MHNFNIPEWECGTNGDEMWGTFSKAGQQKKQRLLKFDRKTKSNDVPILKKSKLKSKKLEINKNLLKKVGKNLSKLKNIGKYKDEHDETNKISIKSFKNKMKKEKLKLKKSLSSSKTIELSQPKNFKKIAKATLNGEIDDEREKLLPKPNKKRKNRRKPCDSQNDNVDTSRSTIDANSITKTFGKNNGSSCVKQIPKKSKKLAKILLRKTEPELEVGDNAIESTSGSKKNKKEKLTLRERMMNKLKASRFRYLNEQIYTVESKEAQKMFCDDPQAFEAYHEGYRQQVKRWPINPVDVIIEKIKKMPKNYIIADFGCGDAKISRTVPQKVHSFDLVAANDRVTACDMAKVPLKKDSADVVVFCLSLMGVNLHEYLREANRILKIGGIMKIAEVESRFEDVEDFIKGVQHFGFKNTWKDLSHSLFYFLDFNKSTNIKKSRTLPTLSLHPCLYKKR